MACKTHVVKDNLGAQVASKLLITKKESTLDQEKKASLSLKNSSVSGKMSDGNSSQLTKTSASANVDFRKSSTSSSNSSEESSCTSSNSSMMNKPHNKSNDIRWEAIQSKDGSLGLTHFRLLKRLGCGDIGSVYLADLTGTKPYFAIKVMDKASLAGRKKLIRAQTEKQILQSLDHPFLPTLYTHFETDKFSCLVMEFCPGGDLHTLRQKQPGKHFTEQAVKFYAAEVLLALEYLHMLGIVYRDLKPENILVREDGHIMLSDFDLSLLCKVSPTLVNMDNESILKNNNNNMYCIKPFCIQPSCAVPTSCFFSGKFKKEKKKETVSGLPELMAEPTSARSMSFVGTHEYLAPEIIKGDGHGSAVDWWTFGIFTYELLFGRTPFKGSGNRATLCNVVGQPLRFPGSDVVDFSVKDLIKGLLVKEPGKRLGFKRGATEIKQHPFFEGINWALIRCATPPHVPNLAEFQRFSVPGVTSTSEKTDMPLKEVLNPNQRRSDKKYLDFDFF